LSEVKGPVIGRKVKIFGRMKHFVKVREKVGTGHCWWRQSFMLKGLKRNGKTPSAAIPRQEGRASHCVQVQKDGQNVMREQGRRK